MASLKELNEHFSMWCDGFKRNKDFILKMLDNVSSSCYYKINTEDNYFNCRVYSKDPSEQGYIRIYEHCKGEFRVQLWTPCKMEYSGVSTFPSARRK
jgi:hypothetical protein